MSDLDRYQRQILLPQVGRSGQDRIGCAGVLLVGCGAIGGVVADQLVRAGVGLLRIADRDLVDWTNLQRQVLFDESDARDARPKALAAEKRLGAINSSVRIDAMPLDVNASNIDKLIDGIDVIVDGTDNAATRYLLNDVAVKRSIPWVYGACVGMEGRAMAIVPGAGPCLRCVFPEAPRPGELPTCDTAGVLGPVAGIVGSVQAALVIRILLGETSRQMLSIDLSADRFRGIDMTDAKRPDCRCCGARQFDFLSQPAAREGRLCGADAVQLWLSNGAARPDLGAIASRIERTAQVDRFDRFVRFEVNSLRVTVFEDGRTIVQGTRDPARARAIVGRLVGT